MLSVDFVMELPLSSGHDTVMTVVDSVSKQAHFILIHMTVMAEGAARLFLHQVWKLHSLPMYIVLDHVSQTSFGHISINSPSILTVSMATESS